MKARPVPGDRAAHGRFDPDAPPRSVQFWATKHHRLAVVGLAALGTVGPLAFSIFRAGVRR
jgi:hypothetical protein